MRDTVEVGVVVKVSPGVTLLRTRGVITGSGNIVTSGCLQLKKTDPETSDIKINTKTATNLLFII